MFKLTILAATLTKPHRCFQTEEKVLLIVLQVPLDDALGEGRAWNVKSGRHRDEIFVIFVVPLEGDPEGVEFAAHVYHRGVEHQVPVEVGKPKLGKVQADRGDSGDRAG